MKAFFHQPKGVYLLSFVQMWNRFSHYGMRALLVLFMIHSLSFSSPLAFGIYGVFCALVELGGIFGARIADRGLGLRKTIMLGGWIIALGHFSLACDLFFPGLALLILGSSLFSTNIAALMGQFYALDDQRRHGGFTLFYMGINIGAFLATILCAFLAENFGWSYGFGVAALGMLIGNCILLRYLPLLEGKGEKPTHPQPFSSSRLLFLLVMMGIIFFLALMHQAITLPFLPLVAIGVSIILLLSLKKKALSIKSLILTLLCYIFFFAAEEQIGSSLLVFGDQMHANSFLGISLSPSVILALNPIVIICLGAAAHTLSKKMDRTILIFLFPFILASIAFFSLLILPTTMGSLMGVVAMISFAELFIGPLTYSHTSKIATAAKDPKIMALVPIVASLAATLGSGLSKIMTHIEYAQGFAYLSGILILCGLVFTYCRIQIGKKRDAPRNGASL